jgi:chromosome segregation ATPase
MLKISPEGTKVDVDLEFGVLKLGVGFPCEVSIHVMTNYEKKETDPQSFDNVRLQANLQSRLKLTVVLYPQNDQPVAINVLIHTSKGKKSAGAISFDVYQAIMAHQFSFVSKLEKCPDKNATLAFSFRYLNVRHNNQNEGFNQVLARPNQNNSVNSFYSAFNVTQEPTSLTKFSRTTANTSSAQINPRNRSQSPNNVKLVFRGNNHPNPNDTSSLSNNKPRLLANDDDTSGRIQPANNDKLPRSIPRIFDDKDQRPKSNFNPTNLKSDSKRIEKSVSINYDNPSPNIVQPNNRMDNLVSPVRNSQRPDDGNPSPLVSPSPELQIGNNMNRTPDNGKGQFGRPSLSGHSNTQGSKPTISTFNEQDNGPRYPNNGPADNRQSGNQDPRDLNNTLAKENEFLKSEIARLQRDLDRRGANGAHSINDLTAQITDLQNQLKSKSDEISKLNADVDQKKKSIDSLAKELQTYKDNTDEADNALKKNLESLQHENERLTQKLSKMTARKVEEKKMMDLEREIKELKRKGEIQEEEVVQKEEKILELKQRLFDLENQAENTDDSKDVRILELEKQLEAKKNELVYNQEENEREMRSKEMDIIEVKRENERIIAENTKLQTRKTELENQLGDLKNLSFKNQAPVQDPAAIESLKSELKAAKNEVIGLKQDLTQKKEDMKTLKDDQRKEVRRLEDEIKELNATLNAEKQKIALLENNNGSLKQGTDAYKIDELNKELLKQKKLVDQYESRLLEMQDKLDYYEAKIEELEEQKETAKASTEGGDPKKIAELQAQLENVGQESAKHKSRVEAIQKELTGKQAEIDGLDILLKSKDEKVTGLQQTIKALEEKQKALIGDGSKSKQTEADAAKIATLTRQLGEKDKELKQLSNEKLRADNLCNELQKEIMEMEAKLGMMESKVHQVI